MEEEYTKLSERNKVIRLQIKQLKEEEEENKRRMIKIQKKYNTSKR
jgi:cell division protein FtsB